VTTEFDAVVADVETAVTVITVYFRHVFIPTGSTPDPFYVVGNDPGRWSTRWTLYTCNAPYVVWAEYCRNYADDVARADPTGGVGINSANLPILANVPLGPALPARSLFSLTFRFKRLADLTTDAAQQTLTSGGFDVADFYIHDYGDCSLLAQAGDRAGWEAFAVPSAAWRPDGRSIVVLTAGRPQFIRQRQLVPAGRPTVAVAYATTYKSSQRPMWLGATP